MDPPPSRASDLVEVGFDREIGRHGIVYRLADGREGAVLWEYCLSYNADPAYIQAALLRRLTAEASRAMAEAGLPKREAARRLGTSPAQVHRLLDPRNERKDIGQMIALLRLLGRRTDLVFAAA
jgi:predicted trehalose synthase